MLILFQLLFSFFNCFSCFNCCLNCYFNCHRHTIEPEIHGVAGPFFNNAMAESDLIHGRSPSQAPTSSGVCIVADGKVVGLGDDCGGLPLGTAMRSWFGLQSLAQLRMQGPMSAASLDALPDILHIIPVSLLQLIEVSIQHPQQVVSEQLEYNPITLALTPSARSAAPCVSTAAAGIYSVKPNSSTLYLSMHHLPLQYE
ncbi:hypothetical protein BSLG_010424 [Batrachochytrium salamandrivorans]|nr:hypothetical protein BSLG_010424 [Batrachochytrium salamandrivorans]